MHRVTIRGVEGVLRHGYHMAGTLGAWTVEKAERGWTLSAAVVSTDAFRVSQRPLAFEARHAQGMWRWSVTSLQVSGSALTAELGSMES